MKNSGLLGKNINYSLSPKIHNEYYKKNNIALYYSLFNVDDNELDKFICDLREKNIIGFNVTIPYKEKVINYIDELKYPADRMKSVNTVLVENKKLIGYNTDYYGFKESLIKNQVDVKEKSCLLVGFGGAASAVLFSLIDLEVSKVTIALRDVEKGKNKIKELLLDDEEKILINNIEEISSLEKYDIVINCTPLGGLNYLDKTPIAIKNIKKNSIFYDLNYNPEKTKFLLEAEVKGAQIVNGLDMLLFQAIKAIKTWENFITKGE